MDTGDIEQSESQQIEAAMGSYLSNIDAAGYKVEKVKIDSGMELIVSEHVQEGDQEIGSVVFRYNGSKVEMELSSSTGDTHNLPGLTTEVNDIVGWLKDPGEYELPGTSKAD